MESDTDATLSNATHIQTTQTTEPVPVSNTPCPYNGPPKGIEAGNTEMMKVHGAA